MLWRWFYLLSLDGPAVALVWQDFLSRCYPAGLLPVNRWTLGLTVWAIYLADRLLDVRGRVQPGETSVHVSYRANPRPALVALILIFAADLAIAFQGLEPRILAGGLVVGLVAVVYLAVYTGNAARSVFPKKFLAALIFTSGVFFDASFSLRPAATFGLLCLANLMLIEYWDRDWRTESGWIPLLVLAVVSVGLGRSRWYYAVGLSSAALALLSYTSGRLSPGARRVLADVVLASPLLLRWS